MYSELVRSVIFLPFGHETSPRLKFVHI